MGDQYRSGILCLNAKCHSGMVLTMRLIDYRKKLGLTQAELAGILGLSQAAVARYEAGKRLPQRDELERIYRGTNGEVTANDFAGQAPVPGEAA